MFTDMRKAVFADCLLGLPFDPEYEAVCCSETSMSYELWTWDVKQLWRRNRSREEEGGKRSSASNAVTELMSSAEFHFNNIGLFIIRLFIFVYLTARALPNNWYGVTSRHIYYLCESLKSTHSTVTRLRAVWQGNRCLIFGRSRDFSRAN
jgi:hypothetical protein